MTISNANCSPEVPLPSAVHTRGQGFGVQHVDFVGIPSGHSDVHPVCDLFKQEGWEQEAGVEKVSGTFMPTISCGLGKEKEDFVRLA